MMDMGHGDRLILADANFPAESSAKRLIRLDGVEIPDLSRAFCRFSPLDTFVPEPVRLMRNLPAEPAPKIWDEYALILGKLDFQRAFSKFSFTDRLPFYDEARSAFAIVQTATTARYANISLQKGVL